MFSDKFANNAQNKKVAESQLSAQIIALLEHYKQTDPLGIPGAPIPDPFPVPYTKQSIGMGTLTMKDTLAYGLSKFRIKSMSLDVNQLMVNIIILNKIHVSYCFHMNILFCWNRLKLKFNWM